MKKQRSLLVIGIITLCLISLFSINANSRQLFKFYSNYEQGMNFNGENYKNNPYLFQDINNVIVVPYYSVPYVRYVYYGTGLRVY